MSQEPASRLQAALGLSSLALGLLMAGRAVNSRRRYSFRGRTVVLTGGSRGLGLELARQLGREGARLWLVARQPAQLEEAAAELRGSGIIVDIISADLRHEADVDRVVERVLATEPVVDVLINNAGMIEVGPFEHLQPVDFENSLAIHFWAPLHLIRKLLPRMRRGGAGRIVNISSIGGRLAVPHLAAYAAGKFALTGLSEALGAELAKSGIYVTTVTPGLMRTGSYVNVQLRGVHAKEFRWFAALAATPLTSMQARRAAAQIIEAAREGRAAVTPLVQARAAQRFGALAPNTFAAISALIDRLVLPPRQTDPAADAVRLASEVDPGRIKHALSKKTRRKYHQPAAFWE